MKDKLKYVLLVAGQLMVLISIGCGSSDHAFVHGTVLCADGSPLVGARVIAHPQDSGKTCYATTDAEGRFSLDTGNEGLGVLPGDYQVAIVEDTGHGDTARLQRTIARKYSEPGTSGLSFSVVTGEKKQLDLNLEDP